MVMTLSQVSGEVVGASQDQAHVQSRSYLAFSLSGPSFGIAATAIVEIIPCGCGAISEPADKPGFIRGVFEYKERLLPIIDLSKRYSTHATAIGIYTCIVVVELGTQLVGVLVDEVQGMVSFSRQDLVPVPELAANIMNVGIVDGLVRDKHEWIIVLGIERVLGENESATLAGYMQQFESAGLNRVA